jgi:hypothetical protein
LPFSTLRLAAITTPLLPAVARAALHPPQVPARPDVTSAPPSAEAAHRAGALAAAPAPVPDAMPDAGPAAEPVPDFSGTWILDEARSGSPRTRVSEPFRIAQWGNVVVIRQGASVLRIESQQGEQTSATSYMLDERDYRYVEDRRSVGGGISLRGADVKTVWDDGKLVTLTRPFSIWVPDEHDMTDAPNRSSMEFVSIRRLSADGQDMIVERVNRHDWGWGFDGREPSAAYARVTDVYRRAAP